MIRDCLLKLKQTILLLAVVLILGCNSSNDNSLDAEQLLEESRQTLKDVDSELERIESASKEAELAYEFEAKAKQPNTIYTKIEENGFSFEYLVSAEAKEEPKPDPDQDELSKERPDTTETHVVVHLPGKIKISKSNDEEPPEYFAFRCATKFLDRDLNRFTGSEVVYSGDLSKWRENEAPKGTMDSGGAENPLDDRKLAVLAVKAELRTSDEPIDHSMPFKDSGDFNRLFDTPEVKGFVASLAYGESGEFEGWHYLKVDRSVAKEPLAGE